MRHRAVWLLLLALLCACGESASEGGAVVVAEESRYRVVAQASARGAGEAVLDVRVESTGGWHIAPEAPVRLDLQASGITFTPAKLRAEHTRTLDESVIEWQCELRAPSLEGQIASAELKFGICEGDAEQCVIIRRKLEISLSGAHP